MRKMLFSMLMVAFSGIITGCSTNPVTGERELMFVSSEEEKRIGEEYAPEVEKQLGGAIQNTQLQNYIDSVGSSIVRQTHLAGEDFEFTAVRDKSVNASALPGGHIFITEGMLRNIDDEAQLAGILAHEVAHVTIRHSSQAISRQIGFDLLLQGIGSATDAPAGALTAADLGGQLLQLRYSREDEIEADTYGMDYMLRAGYDPQGLLETMIMLEQLGGGGFEFLSTHPAPANRQAILEDRIRGMRYSDVKRGEADYQRYVLNNL
ncbi:TPR repeat-containing protein YfgC precursor [Anaerohalosphaera lusitana]|uniref:TPR repeat-containing protein YfgC n=1 Tax=Anaerohalosphaera lusitana TaxID=1936003 RepID=A0A1U9NHW7_9BACT|nr:M48 family metallopeptidase [Anaerohalosphaera lusitana]AQT67357.1 TPR repeat-containing protein YfgC precursor [Anaerohalosphaera lusitana]